jgi:hypothetical protein
MPSALDTTPQPPPAPRPSASTAAQRVQQAANWLPEGPLRLWLQHSRTDAACAARRDVAQGRSFLAVLSEALGIRNGLARHLVRQAGQAGTGQPVTLAAWLEILHTLDQVPPSIWPGTAEQWERAHTAWRCLNASAPMTPPTRQRWCLPILCALHKPEQARERLGLRLRLIDLCGGHPALLAPLSLLTEAALDRIDTMLQKSPFLAIPLGWRMQLNARGQRQVQDAVDRALPSGLQAEVLRSPEQALRWGEAIGNCLGQPFHLERYWTCCPVILGIRRDGAPLLTVAYSRRHVEQRGRIGLRILDWQWVGAPEPQASEFAEKARIAIERTLRKDMLREHTACLHTDFHPVRLWRALVGEIDLRVAGMGWQAHARPAT